MYPEVRSEKPCHTVVREEVKVFSSKPLLPHPVDETRKGAAERADECIGGSTDQLIQDRQRVEIGPRQSGVSIAEIFKDQLIDKCGRKLFEYLAKHLLFIQTVG